MDNRLNTIRYGFADLFANTAFRWACLLLALGAAPCYLLSMACASL